MRACLIIVVGSLTAIATAVGCATTSSSQVSTGQIKPNYSVVVDTYQDGSTYVSAILDQGGGSLSRVKLVGGDTIGASTDKDPVVPLPYDDTLQIYSTTLAKVTDRTVLTIALTRANGTSAKSTAQLPTTIAMTAPASMAQVPFANGTGSVQFTWSNPIQGGTVAVVAFPSCDASAVQASTLTTQGADNGSLVVPTSKLLVNAPSAVGQCILLRIAREVNGTLDPAFAAGGKFTADRFDYMKLVMMP